MTVKRSAAKLAQHASTFGKSEERKSGVRQLSPTLPEERPADKQDAERHSRSGWIIMEEFDRDGFHYRLTRRPAAATRHPRLTKRENEALSYASRGYTNNGIALVLGVAPSTVRVLLSRAAGKLGTSSRQELLMAYARQRGVSEEP